MPKKYWMGKLEDECQLCKRPFAGVMYDCAIPDMGGMWGNICRRCYLEHDCHQGLGRGQEYELQKDKRWLKVGG